MKTILNILEGFYYFLLYKIGWLPDELNNLMQERESVCNKCPLKDGIYCSKNRAQKYKSIGDLEAPEVLYITENTPHYNGRIYYNGAYYKKGCGCLLFLKWLVKKEKCPLNKW